MRVGKVERAGFTLMPLDLHYEHGRVKLQIGLAKGKKNSTTSARRKKSATGIARRPKA